MDDRRVISGIVHMLKSGARWRDCPPEYGPCTAVYNRFNRWSRHGVWLGMFEALTGHNGIWGTVAIDATHIKAHRSAADAKRAAFAQAIGSSRGGRTSKLHESPRGAWRLADDLETTLRQMGERGDIIRTMQRQMRDRAPERPAADHPIYEPEKAATPLVGPVIARGLADEHADRHYLIVDGVDGLSGYVDIGIATAET